MNKHISELKGTISFMAVKDSQLDNLNFLRQGVVGVECVYAERYSEELLGKLFYISDLADALQVINARCFQDEKLGTVEVYYNESFNVYLKQDKGNGHIVTGMYTYRLEK